MQRIPRVGAGDTDTTAASEIADEYREQERLTLLAELGVLDTAPEPGFDALTDAAAAVTECPIALVSLVDGDRQWFKARRGIDDTQTPRAWSFCSHRRCGADGGTRRHH